MDVQGVVALYKIRCCPNIYQGGLRKTIKISDRIRNPIRPGYTGTDPVLWVLKTSVPVSRRILLSRIFSATNIQHFYDSQAPEQPKRTHAHTHVVFLNSANNKSPPSGNNCGNYNNQTSICQTERRM